MSVPVLGGENSATFWRVRHVHNLGGDLCEEHLQGGHMPWLWGEECATSWRATHVPYIIIMIQDGTTSYLCVNWLPVIRDTINFSE